MTDHCRARALLVAVAMLTLASCGGGKVLSSGDARVLVGSDDGDNMPIVGFGGKVSMVGDCLGIVDAVVVWPPGTKVVSGDPLTIDVDGLGSVVVGDSVDGGGVQYDRRDPPDGTKVPKSCEGKSLIGFFPHQ